MNPTSKSATAFNTVVAVMFVEPTQVGLLRLPLRVPQEPSGHISDVFIDV